MNDVRGRYIIELMICEIEESVYTINLVYFDLKVEYNVFFFCAYDV